MEIIIDGEKYICFKAKEFFEELEKNGYKWDGKTVVKKEDKQKFYVGDNVFKWEDGKGLKKEQNKPKFKVGDIIRNEPTGVFMAIKEIKDDSYITTDGTMLLFKYQDKWELVGSKVNPSLENRIPTSQEINYAANNMKSLENKVSVLADEIIALKEKLLALEKLAKDSEIKIDALECGGKPFQCPDKAGDSVTLEEMNR